MKWKKSNFKLIYEEWWKVLGSTHFPKSDQTDFLKGFLAWSKLFFSTPCTLKQTKIILLYYLSNLKGDILEKWNIHQQQTPKIMNKVNIQILKSYRLQSF